MQTLDKTRAKEKYLSVDNWLKCNNKCHNYNPGHIWQIMLKLIMQGLGLFLMLNLKKEIRYLNSLSFITCRPIHPDCGRISVLEPRHAGELLPICSAEERLQGGAPGLRHYRGLTASFNTQCVISSSVCLIHPGLHVQITFICTSWFLFMLITSTGIHLIM